MRGRFTLIHGLETILYYYNIKETDLPYQISFNIAPSQPVTAVISDGVNNRIGQLRWGLVPSWAKDSKIGYKMINARAETIYEKPAFKKLLTRRRCLIPADSFFEWKIKDGRKIPMRIHLKENTLFSFAGLWDRWEKDGQILQTCTIITTKANRFMSDIHERMPVILTKETESEWLNPEINDPKQLKSLLTPYDSERMKAYEVSSLVNSPKNNVPETILPAGN
jgi:putative SOS response-associated peptidase YedK